MKELTRIITAEITMIRKGEERDFRTKEESKAAWERALKRETRADDIKVTNVQDFIIDKPEQTWKDSMMQHFVKGE
jgi:hypothetical protein